MNQRVVFNSITLGLVSVLFAIYVYFLVDYWVGMTPWSRLLGEFILLFTAVVGVAVYVRKSVRAESIKIELADSGVNTPFYIVLSGILLVSLILSCVISPFPPIFNIHAFNTMELGEYFFDSSVLPFFPIEKISPVTGHSLIYPQEIIFAYILKFAYGLSFSLLSYIVLSNLLASFFSIAGGFGVYLLFEDKRDLIPAFVIYCLVLLAFPTNFEVFMKYPGSDVFTLFFATLVILFAIHFIKTGNYLMLLFCMAFSVVVRLYLGIINIIFILIFGFFCLIAIRGKVAAMVLELFKNWKRLLFLLFCVLVAFSWSFTLYNKYKTPVNDYSRIGFLGGSVNKEEKLFKDFFKASMLPAVPEKTSLEELLMTVTTQSIYYKTFEATEAETEPIIDLFNLVFSSIAVLLLFTIIGGVYLIKVFKGKTRFQLEAIVCLLWLVSCFLAWLLLSGSDFPIIKIFISAFPALALLATFFILDLLKKGNRSWVVKVVAIYLLTSFIYTNTALPVYRNVRFGEIIEKGPIQSDFINKYGFKNQIISYLVDSKIDSKEVLWVVRGEHGGMLPFFIPDWPFSWNLNWYDSTRYADIHKAKTEHEVVSHLKQNGITHIISMKNTELDRFIISGFRNMLGYPEIIVDMIKNHSENLKEVFREEKLKGLEMIVFTVIYNKKAKEG